MGSFNNTTIDAYSANLRLGYNFEADGTDLTGNNNMTLFNSPSFVSGMDGNGIATNGSNQYGVIANGARDADTSATLAMWIKGADASNYQTLFSVRDASSANYYLRCALANVGGLKLELETKNTALRYHYADTTVVCDGSTWNHVAWVSTGTGYIFYLNGSDDGITSVGSANGDWFADVRNGTDLVYNIFRTSNSGPHYFNGVTDGMYYWDTALSTSAISALAAGAFWSESVGGPQLGPFHHGAFAPAFHNGIWR